MSVKEWDICISGFTQTQRRETGTELLWQRLREHASHSRCVQIREWRSDWTAAASFIYRNSVNNPVIRVFAYSWGAGWGFVRLALALAKRGLKITVAVLCDPIYRFGWLPTWLPANPISLTRFPKIRVPEKVDEVYWLYQTQDRPRGHEPISPSNTTKIHPGIQLDCGHVYADRAHQYHELARQIAAGGTP